MLVWCSRIGRVGLVHQEQCIGFWKQEFNIIFAAAVGSLWSKWKELPDRSKLVPI